MRESFSVLLDPFGPSTMPVDWPGKGITQVVFGNGQMPNSTGDVPDMQMQDILEAIGYERLLKWR